MSERFEFYVWFLLPLVTLGFAFGRYVVADDLYVPVPPTRIGKVIFGALMIFWGCRTLFTYVASQVSPQDSQPLVLAHVIGSYADITTLTLAIMFGYHTKRHRVRKSIRGGLVVAEDGGLHIVEPQFVEDTYKRELPPKSDPH